MKGKVARPSPALVRRAWRAERMRALWDRRSDFEEVEEWESRREEVDECVFSSTLSIEESFDSFAARERTTVMRGRKNRWRRAGK